MKPRKLILIIADLILLAVLIINLIISSKSSIKNFEIKEDINSILITKADGEISLTKNGEDWFVGNENLPAENYSVENLVEAVSSIKVLDKVASLSEYTKETYEFTDNNSITVLVKNNDKVLRKIVLGKKSTVYSQTFITLDDKNDIYLSTGSLRSKFEITENDLIKAEPEPEQQPEASSEADNSIEDSLEEPSIEL
ncbi:MAG: DUF4340 domain-containing protein [Spirochaetales bacterium]|nr:DUF4340 domain-containing protein [Spirochaetales bacterium]